jgi:hypothetical protein
MTTLTNPTSHPATPGRTHPTMIIATCPETVSLDVVHTAPVKAATFLRCSIWRTGVGTHPLSNAIVSRDAP